MAQSTTKNRRRSAGALWWDQTLHIPDVGVDSEDKRNAGWTYAGFTAVFNYVSSNEHQFKVSRETRIFEVCDSSRTYKVPHTTRSFSVDC